MLVLDSSVTIAWYVPDEFSGESQALRQRVVASGAVIPMHWRIEVGNALMLAMRRNRISAQASANALAHLVGLQLSVDEQTLDRAWTDSMALAERFRLTLYDACYLELAQRRALPLASLDRDLRAAGTALGLEMLGA